MIQHPIHEAVTAHRRPIARTQFVSAAPAGHALILVAAVEGAEILRVSLRKFHALRKTAGFPQPIKLGALSVRWRVADLAAYVESLPAHQSEGEPARLKAAKGSRRGGGTPGVVVHRVSDAEKKRGTQQSEALPNCAEKAEG